MVSDDTLEPRQALRHNITQLIESNEEIQGSIIALAKLTGISRQGLSKLVKGSADNPGLDTLLAISSTLGVTVSQLIGQLPLEAKFADKGIRHVPILLWQQAKKAKELAPKKNLGNWDDWIVTTTSLSASSFALRIESKQLEPYFYNSSVLIVDPEVEPIDNDYVIVQSKTCHKGRLKKIVIDGNFWLHSLINEHPPIELSNQSEYSICGVVLQSIVLYRDE